MTNIAAGLLMCRRQNEQLEFFLVHPGGPFYIKKNEGVWSIPKGLPENGEDLLMAAQREFYEETGITPSPPYQSLGTVKLKSGKTIHAWSFEGDWDVSKGIVSNIFKMEWPPSSKKFIDVPEVDKAAWMPLHEASKMINPQQIPFLSRAQKFYEP